MTIKPIETVWRGYRFRSQCPPSLPKNKMRADCDRTGLRFGRLMVEEMLGVASGGTRWWGCLCDCGQRVAVRGRELDRGNTRSCGCLSREIRKAQGGLNRLPYGHASRNELLGSYKKSARDRGHEWSLLAEDFFRLVASPCAYCGVEPNLVRKPNAGVNGEFTYTGIDRIDNQFGYALANVTACCWDCNRAKGKLGLADFLTWVGRLSSHQAARAARFEHGEDPDTLPPSPTASGGRRALGTRRPERLALRRRH